MATVRERILSSGVDPERAEKYLRDGWIRVDGQPVTDGDTEAGERIVIAPPPSVV